MLNVLCSFIKLFLPQTNHIWCWNICLFLTALSLLYSAGAASITSCHVQLQVIRWPGRGSKSLRTQTCTGILWSVMVLNSALQHRIHVQVEQFWNDILCNKNAHYPWRSLNLFAADLLPAIRLDSNCYKWALMGKQLYGILWLVGRHQSINSSLP